MSVAFFLSSPPKIAVFLRFFLHHPLDLIPLDFHTSIIASVHHQIKKKFIQKYTKIVMNFC